MSSNQSSATSLSVSNAWFSSEMFLLRMNHWNKGSVIIEIATQASKIPKFKPTGEVNKGH